MCGLSPHTCLQSMIGKIVIGAAFGDEGKGLFTDYFVSQMENPIVVRFNSGAQCSHTVVTPEGNRHVFSHIGCGSFLNAPTYLSEYVVTNPLLFCKEYDELGLKPIIMVDRKSLVTTPFDMMINRLLEKSRNDQKHGSCGIGFGETIERDERGFGTRVGELVYPNRFLKRMQEIGTEYLPIRLKELGLVTAFEKSYANIIDDILKRFMVDVKDFLNKVTISIISDIKDRNIVFEGAQGLMLDMDYGEFPYVTRSNTGLKNALALCDQLGLVEVDVTYVTRAYATRHGVGPFPTETENIPYSNVVETTNVTNDWQGKFRFGVLDLPILCDSIYYDMGEIEQYLDIDFKFNIGITCMDQINDLIRVETGPSVQLDLPHDEFFNILKKSFFGFNFYRSDGPTRNNIVKLP